MRWRSDARFAWCDESMWLSVHTICDKTVFPTLWDLYVCSRVRSMSYASDNCRDSCFAYSNAAVEQTIKTYKGPFTQRASDDAAMHVFLGAMKRRDRVFILHAIKPLFSHCQIYICVVNLETCPMRAITVAMDLARVVTRQCEYIIKIYSVPIFPLVALLHRSLACSLCERTLEHYIF